MNRNLILAVGAAVVVVATPRARADVLLFDIEADPEGWVSALARGSYLSKWFLDFANLPDLGFEVMDGPISRDGNESGTIPVNFFPHNMAFDSNLSPFGIGGPNGRGDGGGGLLGLGPSAGFGNAVNALVASHAADGFDMIGLEIHKGAMSFEAASFLGNGTVDITVYGFHGRLLAQFHDIPAPEDGHEYGIIVVDSKRTIGHVNIYDPSGGLEGITREAKFYIRQFPGPGCIPLMVITWSLLRSRSRKAAT